MKALVKFDCPLCIRVAEFGEHRETLFKDAIYRRTGLEGPRVIPGLSYLFMEELDVSITGEDVVGYVRSEGLVSTGVDELDREFLYAQLAAVIFIAGEVSDVVPTDP